MAEITKENLLELINQLPNDKKALYDSDNFELLPNTINGLLTFLAESYPAIKLRPYMNTKGTEDEFPFLIMSISESLNPLYQWLRENMFLFEEGKLFNSVKSQLLERRKSLKEKQEEIQKLNALLPDLKVTVDQFTKETNEFAEKENRYRELVGQKEDLAKRRDELIKLENEIKEGRLEELDEEVKSKQIRLGQQEAKRDALLKSRNEILQKQKEAELEVKRVVNQTKLIGSTEELFNEFRAKCADHNQSVLEQQTKDVDDLLINLDFTSRTSTGVMDNSMHEKLKRAKLLVQEVEDAIKNKLTQSK